MKKFDEEQLELAIIDLFIKMVIISLNSESPFLIDLESVAETPNPIINEKTRVVVTLANGGISMVKNSLTLVSAENRSDTPELMFTNNSGTKVEVVRYEKRPESIVERYAIKTVTSSIFPALFPISAIPGATSPNIIRGITKPR